MIGLHVPDCVLQPVPGTLWLHASWVLLCCSTLSGLWPVASQALGRIFGSVGKTRDGG